MSCLCTFFRLSRRMDLTRAKRRLRPPPAQRRSPFLGRGPRCFTCAEPRRASASHCDTLSSTLQSLLSTTLWRWVDTVPSVFVCPEAVTFDWIFKCVVWGKSGAASLASIIPLGTPACRPQDYTSTDLPFGLNPHVTEHPALIGHRLIDRGALGKYDAYSEATCRCFPSAFWAYRNLQSISFSKR